MNVYLGPNQSLMKNAYIGEYVPPYLCFTANTAGSTVQLKKNGSPVAAVTLETSSDGGTWSTYTIGSTITLSNIGDKVYFRNTSTTDTGFSSSTSNYYYFVMSGSIAGSGDINYLLNKNDTDTLSNYCYVNLFNGCTSLISAPNLSSTSLSYACYQQMFGGSGLVEAPILPATTLGDYCYYAMFSSCSNLESLPKLPALILKQYCYNRMFISCPKIKLSTTQTGEYQTAYRIPTSGTGTTASSVFDYMFYGTGGTFTGTPSINTTYYTSNTVV